MAARAELKVGDRVRHRPTGKDGWVHDLTHSDPTSTVVVDFDDGRLGVDHDDLTKLEDADHG